MRDKFPPLEKQGHGGLGVVALGGQHEYRHRKIPLDPPFAKGEVICDECVSSSAPTKFRNP